MIFSFLLTCKINEMKKDLDQQELRFLLTGGIALGGELPPVPCDWLSNKSWGEINRLGGLPAFRGFVDHFTEEVDYYKEMNDSPTPHTFRLKGLWNTKLNSF